VALLARGVADQDVDAVFRVTDIIVDCGTSFTGEV
jgi:hypothetical protein